MTQLPLFDRPPAVKTCGNCVCRNARNEREETGYCAATDRERARDDPACERWFGLEQLRAPLYGRQK